MVIESSLFLNYIFNGLYNDTFNSEEEKVGNLFRHFDYYDDLADRNNQYFTVDPDLATAFPPDLGDLVRLHYLVVSRRVTTILEFGVGKSTIVFNDALKVNSREHKHFTADKLRRSDPYKCYSVDNYREWIDELQKKYDLECVEYCFSELEMGTFEARVCTYYSNIPNVCPDFIYIDGPDQFSPVGDIRGVSTNHPDRLPMAADVLSIEHFLLPGTLIVVDGRTANARFLRANFQRNWLYYYSEDFDQHFFELCERPLGIYNKRQIEFCLGDSFFERLALFES